MFGILLTCGFTGGDCVGTGACTCAGAGVGDCVGTCVGIEAVAGGCGAIGCIAGTVGCGDDAGLGITLGSALFN